MGWHQVINGFLGDPLWALLVGLVGGGLVGGAIGYATSWWFARGSSKELRREVDDLRARVMLPARMLELHALGDKATMHRNEAGDVVGLNIESLVTDQLGEVITTQGGETIVVTTIEPFPEKN